MFCYSLFQPGLFSPDVFKYSGHCFQSDCWYSEDTELGSGGFLHLHKCSSKTALELKSFQLRLSITRSIRKILDISKAWLCVGIFHAFFSPLVVDWKSVSRDV